MNNIFNSYLITFLAGFSTMIGTLLVFLKKDTDKLIIRSLSFSAGVMIGLSVFDLLIEGIRAINNYYVFNISLLMVLIFFVLGILISSFINDRVDKYYNENTKEIYKLGILSLLVLVIHNIPEGIITFIAASTGGSDVGLSLALGIALHNIPEGIIISLPICHGGGGYKKAFLFTLVASFAEPLGAFITHMFLSNFINNYIIGALFSMTAGIMIHIAMYEIIPCVFKYKKYWLFTLYFILGLIFIYVTVGM